MSRISDKYASSWQKRFADWMRDGWDGLDSAFAGDETPRTEKQSSEETDRFTRKALEDRARQRDVYSRLHLWSVTTGARRIHILYVALALCTCIAIIFFLLQAVEGLPPFASADSPVNNEVSRRYIESGIAETGAVNLVSGMILDYRAFDTLGESTVLFIAVCAVMILLRTDRRRHSYEKGSFPPPRDIGAEKEDPILKHGAMFLVPVILLFGIAMVLNGHLSAGGGFAGGAVLGAGLMLFLNAFGRDRAVGFIDYRVFLTVIITALTFYAGAKSFVFYTGANGIAARIPLGQPGAILSAGLILPLDICVGMIVSCTMYGFYNLFRKGGF